MSNQSNMPPCILSAWELHESELHHWLLRQLGNQEDAADALHDVFLKAVSKGTTFCEIDNTRAWLFQVARNYLADAYRKTRSFTELADIPGSELTQENQTEKAAVDELTQCLPRLLTELTSEDSNIIRCCDINGMTLQDYAEANQLTLTATKSRIQRARKRLRENLIQNCKVVVDKHGAVCCFTPRK